MRMFFLLGIMIVVFFQLPAQGVQKNLIGKYNFYALKEDSIEIFRLDDSLSTYKYQFSKWTPMDMNLQLSKEDSLKIRFEGRRMYEMITNRYFEITSDSFSIHSENRKIKSGAYTWNKDQSEMIFREHESESKVNYVFKDDKLFLFIKNGDKDVEFILTRKL